MNTRSKFNIKLNIKSKIKAFLLKVMMKTPNIMLSILGVMMILIFIALLFIIPIFQDYNSRNLLKYKVISCDFYEVKQGDTLSEIAERFKPKHMKLSNYIAEIQVKNSVSKDIKIGDKLLIPVGEIK